jgi:hypothetical protein
MIVVVERTKKKAKTAKAKRKCLLAPDPILLENPIKKLFFVTAK